MSDYHSSYLHSSHHADLNAMPTDIYQRVTKGCGALQGWARRGEAGRGTARRGGTQKDTVGRGRALATGFLEHVLRFLEGGS
eukprot:8700475-Alexandrium_andersonii.AAC.1